MNTKGMFNEFLWRLHKMNKATGIFYRIQSWTSQHGYHINARVRNPVTGKSSGIALSLKLQKSTGEDRDDLPQGDIGQAMVNQHSYDLFAFGEREMEILINAIWEEAQGYYARMEVPDPSLGWLPRPEPITLDSNAAFTPGRTVISPEGDIELPW